MKLPTERLSAFSDGVIAIIITIMVLEIPLPSEINTVEVRDFLVSIGIYFVSFLVVGVQWNRHHKLFHNFKEGTEKIFWLNILYLFFLSLIPIFTKWIMLNPKEVVPASLYSIVYMLTVIIFTIMKIRLIKENPDNEISIRAKKLKQKELEKRGIDDVNVSIIIMFSVIVLCIVAVLSYCFPTIGISLFLIFPIFSSLFDIWHDRLEKDN